MPWYQIRGLCRAMPSRAALGDRQSWPIRHRPKNDLGLGQSHVILKGIQNGGSGSGCGPTFLLAQRQISVLQHSISPHCCQQGTMVLQVGCSKCLPCGGSSCTARAQGMQIPNAGHRQYQKGRPAVHTQDRDARKHSVQDLPSPPCRQGSCSAIQPQTPHAAGEASLCMSH